MDPAYQQPIFQVFFTIIASHQTQEIFPLQCLYPGNSGIVRKERFGFVEGEELVIEIFNNKIDVIFGLAA
jgi:hypothetical protein